MGKVLVIAVVNGALYGLFALGVSLLYRGTRTISFALGEIGTAGLYATWVLHDNGIPWLLAALGGLLFGAAVTLAFERLVVRPMGRADRVGMAVASIGLLSFLLAAELYVYSASPRQLDPPLPGSALTLFGVVISKTQVLSIVVLVVLALGLTVVLRRTDFGLGVLAAAQDPDAANLVGVELPMVARFTWGVAGLLAVGAAVLAAPDAGAFAPAFATVIFLKGLIAAVIGGLSSIQGAAVGGFAVGLLEAAGRDIFSETSVPGIELLILLVAVLAVLLFRPTGLLAQARTRGAA